jgi:putative ABC transport system permease protein
MRRIDIVKRAARNLRQAKGRTFLTALAIGVGAFTLTLSLAAGEGARQYADNLLKNNIDPQALFIVKDKSVTDGGSTGLQEYSTDTGSAVGTARPGATVKVMTRKDVEKLEKRSDLKQVTPIYQLSPSYTEFAGNSKKYSAPVTYYDSTILSEATAGNVPKLGMQINDTEILVPQEFADTLGVSAASLIGKKVSISMPQAQVTASQEEILAAFQAGGQAAVADLIKPKTKVFSFTVRAVLKKPSMAIASNPRLHISPAAARTLSDYANKGSDNDGKYVGVTALAIGDAAAVKKTLVDTYGYSVQTAKDAQNFLFTFVNILQGIVAGFGFLALIASVFGIINTQYISVLERTSQIGLMKALGMSRRAIAKLFRYEAAWIGFLGGVLGATTALILGWIINPMITKALDLGENSLLIFVWWHIATLILALVMVAIGAGFFPARKAAKLDPIEALRTE